MNERWWPWLCFLLALVLHAGWASTVQTPDDLDAQYYLLVARNLATGQGAVTASLWNLSLLPEALPLAADLHWMPLPSRVLVPGLWLWPARGDQLVSVLLASAWAPLAWALARALAAERSVALGAALLAASGGVYARYLVMPDCYALYGLLGGLGLLAVVRGSWSGAAVVAALAALTRNDGLLLGPCLALGFVGWRAWGVAAVGPLASAAWMLRNHLLAGSAYWEARQLSTQTADYLTLFTGELHEPLSVLGRAEALVGAAPELAAFWLTPGLLVLTPPMAWAAWQHRAERWVRVLLVYVALAPVITVWLAPAIALHGTLYRSGAAMLPGQLALAAIGLHAAGGWTERVRGYPRPFVPALLGGAYVLIALGMGAQRAVEPRRPQECALVAGLPAGAPVLTSRPLEMELNCGRPGVMVTRVTSAERVALVVGRYGVRHAVASEDRWTDEGSVAARHLERLLPGWRRDGLVFTAPE